MLSTSRRSLLQAGSIAATGLAVSGLISPGQSRAQSGPSEPKAGVQYRQLPTALPTDDANKVEVIEFFWFGCPHCNSIEPLLAPWLKKQPADVAFRKEHVGFPQAVKHQQLFYTIKALGIEDKMNAAVFDAIHQKRQLLTQTKDMAALAEQLAGIDPKKFTEVFNSFTVKTRMKRAMTLAENYKVDGVPAFAVNGKYYTAPAMAGGNGGVLQVLDYLIAKERPKR